MNRIKELRLKKHLTQEELANAIGMSRQGLAYYEQGKREPKLETWQKLADYFNVSIPYLQGLQKFATEEIIKEMTLDHDQIEELKNELRKGNIQHVDSLLNKNLSNKIEMNISDQSLIDMLCMVYRQYHGYTLPDFLRKKANLTTEQKRKILNDFSDFLEREVTQNPSR